MDEIEYQNRRSICRRLQVKATGWFSTSHFGRGRSPPKVARKRRALEDDRDQRSILPRMQTGTTTLAFCGQPKEYTEIWRFGLVTPPGTKVTGSQDDTSISNIRDSKL